MPKATDADTTIALVRELEKLPARVSQTDSTKTAGDDCPTKRAKHATSDVASSSKARDKSKSDASMTATSIKPTVKSCLIDAGLSLGRIAERQPAIDEYGITTVADLHELYRNGTPDPDLTNVIKFSKIEVKRLTNRLDSTPVASAAEPDPGSLDVSAISVVSISDTGSPASRLSEADRHYNRLQVLGNLKHTIAERTPGAPVTLSGTNGLGRHFTRYVQQKVSEKELCAERLTASENGSKLQISLHRSTTSVLLEEAKSTLVILRGGSTEDARRSIRTARQS